MTRKKLVVEAYEAWKDFGQRAHTVLKDIWRSLTPDGEYGTFGDDPQKVWEVYLKYLAEDRDRFEKIQRVEALYLEWVQVGQMGDRAAARAAEKLQKALRGI